MNSGGKSIFKSFWEKCTVNSPVALESLKWTLLGVITTSHITEHQILGYLFPTVMENNSLQLKFQLEPLALKLNQTVKNIDKIKFRFNIIE